MRPFEMLLVVLMVITGAGAIAAAVSAFAAFVKLNGGCS